MKKQVIKLRILFGIILFLIVGFILYKGVVPTGKIAYVYDFEKKSKFIGKLMPEERVSSIDNDTQKIIGDPVYFSVWTPRTFDNAKVSIKYKNQENNLIEAGILVDGTIWRYDLKPIENRALENINLVWPHIDEDGIVLFQRSDLGTSTYATIDDFINNPPRPEKVAVYNFDLDYEYLIDDYEKDDAGYAIDQPIRGNYQFYTYIKDEELNFKFDFLDINKNKDSDEVDVHLYYQDILIDSGHLEDDGILSDEGEQIDERSLSLNLENLPEGVYKIEIRANDDIITQRIDTAQSKLAFLNKVWVYGDDEKDFNITTDSGTIRAKIINPASLQKIKIGEKELDINETYKQFMEKVDNLEVVDVELEKQGVVLEGDGVFSFSQESFFDPQIKKFTPDLDIKKTDIDYVIASYSVPKKENDWRIAELSFDLNRVYREDGKYSFLISVPGIGDDRYMEIDEIKVEFVGKNLIEKLKSIF